MSDKSINQILHDIQVKLSVPKTRFNKFGNYNYRNAEDIVDAVKALLPDGCAFTLSDEIVMLGDRFYIKAQALLFCADSQVIAYGYAREPEEQKGMAEPQITGSASSYARKYALNGLFAIDDGVDADSQDNSSKVSKAPKVVTPKDTADRLITKAKTFTEFKALKEWTKLQVVIDARDKLFDDDKALSDKVDAEIAILTAALP